MKINFITTNQGKFEEVKDILKDYPIELIWLNRKYAEDHDDTLEDVVKKAAKTLAEELKEPIVLEDTGLFLDAYPGFPGPAPKFAIKTLGFKGFLKLLEGESRKAEFRTIAAYCEPGKDPVLFTGTMDGELIDEIRGEENNFMPYDRFYQPKGYNKTICEMTLQEKTKLSQRGEAFRKFGEYIKNINK